MDGLHGSLSAHLGQVGTHVTVCLLCHSLQVHFIRQLHVLRVDTQNLQTPDLIRHTDVNLAVKPAEPAKGPVDNVRPVRSRKHDHLAASLHPVHQRQQLRNDALLNLSLSLFTLRCDTVDLVYENDRRCLFLRLLERLPQVGLRLTRHLAHDLRTVDQEEECTSLVRDRASDRSLSAPGRSVQQDTARRLDTDVLVQVGVADRQLHHLTDLAQLLPAPADVLVAHVSRLLLVLALDRLTLAVNHRVGRNDTVLVRVRFHDLELNLTHRPAAREEVSLAHWPVRLEEVRLEEGVEQVTGQSLDSVIDGQHVDTRSVLDVLAGADEREVSQPHPQVRPRLLVHAHLAGFHCVVLKHDTHRRLSALPLEQDRVTAEQLQLLHRVRVQPHHAVVVIRRLLDHQLVRLPAPPGDTIRSSHWGVTRHVEACLLFALLRMVSIKYRN
eukprot:Hpha_TRINITY_DN16838_c0_g3::TRINITY_DN16838_c0_g3_i6::g.151697::m.151697